MEIATNHTGAEKAFSVVDRKLSVEGLYANTTRTRFGKLRTPATAFTGVLRLTNQGRDSRGLFRLVTSLQQFYKNTMPLAPATTNAKISACASYVVPKLPFMWARSDNPAAHLQSVDYSPFTAPCRLIMSITNMILASQPESLQRFCSVCLLPRTWLK